MIKKMRKKGTLGVTLIEILVSMVILSVGLFMVYNIFPMGFAASYRSKNRTIATQLAQETIESVIHNKTDKFVPALSGFNDGATHCQLQTGGTCRFRPLEDNYNSPDYTSSFDCRYFFGGDVIGGKVQDATYCKYHSGLIGVATNWNRYSDDSDSPFWLFWYQIAVTPMTDPAQKFRNVGNMCRITVTVRGPVADMNDWDTLINPPDLNTPVGQNRDSGMGRKSKLPTEVALSTVIANKYIPFTTIDTTYSPSNWHNGVYDDASGSIGWYDPTDSKCQNGRTIRLNNVRNFSMFYNLALSPDEKKDRSKVEYHEYMDYDRNGTVGDHEDDREIHMVNQGGNFYGLDNILIVRNMKVTDSSGRLYRDIYVSQTNKIMLITPDTTVNPETTAEIPGSITLYDRLYVDYQDYSPDGLDLGHGVGHNSELIDRGLPSKTCNLDASIINKERLLGTDLPGSLYYSCFDPSYSGTSHANVPYQGSVPASTVDDPMDDRDYTGSWDGAPDTLGDFEFPYQGGLTYAVTYYVWHPINIKKPGP
ncbi:MAG: prepilin-type N-terminal cleavage/methylation domain-containing protein [Candidatus Eremiobacteraeota bacterium]|nr:prepilin-type N-terminal cleavage/methylation domain-containing protein [Candidatus Eremiobacteraeota bacterium]